MTNQEAIQMLKSKLNGSVDTSYEWCECVRLAINALETADVKHGRWIEKPPYKDETVKGLEFQIVCSECDEQNCSLEFDENYNAIGKTFYKTRYCPNCGARMDGDTE